MRFAPLLVVTALGSMASADPPHVPLEIEERATELLVDHDIDFALNPFYLRGDFDGDGKPDYVVGMRPKKGDAERRFVVLRASGKPQWLDQDDKLAYPPLKNSPAWSVVDRRTKVRSGWNPATPPKLRGDAILFEKLEASSSLVFWNGKRFVGYWLTD